MSEMERTFGIEIECHGPGREDLYRELCTDGLSVNVPYGVGEWSIEKWTLKGDGSINPGPGQTATELTSPILVGFAGLKELRTACLVLKRLGAQTNSSCGVHVHIGVSDMTGMEAYTVVRRYHEGEAEIDSFMKMNRRGDRAGYAQSMALSMKRIADHQAVWEKAGNPSGFKAPHFDARGRRVPAVGNITTDMTTFCQYSGANKRTKVNANAFFKFQTIEFRHHHGSVDADELVNWVRFLQNFVERSVKLTKSKTARDNGPMTGLPTRVRKFFRSKIAERAA